MKKKLAIANFLLGTIVLAAILFQSFHSFEHLTKLLSEEHCDHKYASDRNEISHSHHDFDDCFTCEFTLSPAVSDTSFNFGYFKQQGYLKPALSYDKQIPLSFSGSLLKLRGPPSV